MGRTGNSSRSSGSFGNGHSSGGFSFGGRSSKGSGTSRENSMPRRKNHSRVENDFILPPRPRRPIAPPPPRPRPRRRRPPR